MHCMILGLLLIEIETKRGEGSDSDQFGQALLKEVRAKHQTALCTATYQATPTVQSFLRNWS